MTLAVYIMKVILVFHSWKVVLDGRVTYKCQRMQMNTRFPPFSLLPATIHTPDPSHCALSVWLALAQITPGHIGD